ncbi:hypothetical protein QBC39DRAFT_363442 [Podospora conica]|nr:hypothetical protein QBC39DRAFT_363442 [Schizothecium conicum]
MRNRKRTRGKPPLGGANPPRPQNTGSININTGGRASQASSRPGSAPPHGFFSMRDEARNTASHMSPWGQNEILRATERLRQKPVAFVSAGFVEPLKEIQPVEDDTKTATPAPEDVNKPLASKGDTAGPDTADKVSTPVNDVPEAAPDVETKTIVSHDENIPPQTQTAAFFFDLTGDKKVERPASQQRMPDSTEDVIDSSDEVILFKGRGKSQRNARGGGSAPAARKQQRGQDGRRFHDIAGPSASKPATSPTTRSHPNRQARPQDGKQPASDSEEEDVEDAILADYIANMAANSDDDDLGQTPTFNTRDLGGEGMAFGTGPADICPPGDDFPVTKDDAIVDSETSGASDDEEESDSDEDVEALARMMKRQHPLGSGTPNAASVTDAFGEMDIGSWDPPNLVGRRKGRRRKEAPDFGVADSDMERHLKSTWENDRERKKAKKLEREALRASGLLGKNAKPEDLRVKYLTGMTLDEIKEELLAFLLSSEETIQFPPMDKQARKVLHELANRFKIKSQSTGKGDQRRPVLYRTNRTLRYDESRYAEASRYVDEAAMRIKRKYFHRLDAKGKPQPRPPGSGGGFNAAVRYRDGEIAGASIPELGQENKGRAMLEKMGWAKGTGLGAIENKGILLPVAQVVKSTKAGLG